MVAPIIVASWLLTTLPDKFLVCPDASSTKHIVKNTVVYPKRMMNLASSVNNFPNFFNLCLGYTSFR